MYDAPQILSRGPQPSLLIAAALFGIMLASRALAQDTRPAMPTTRPTVAAYQRGVRIDWQNRQVEADGQVVLREGPLELFACSPRTREHESIVCIDARPLHVFQALGLIGIAPGHPGRFDPLTREYQPAQGDPLEIEVRYSVAGQTRLDPIERWMRRIGPEGKPESSSDLEAQLWVFAGSYTGPEGVFTADVEGTVIALVNFDSSLVALPESHSDSNSELWLAPATERIPPLGTRCTLIFRPAPIRIELDSAGQVRLGRHTLSMAEAVRTLRRIHRDNPTARLILRVDPQCPPASKSELLAIMDLLKIEAESKDVPQADTPLPVRHDARAFGRWIHENGLFFGPASASRPGATGAAQRIASELAARARILQTRGEDLAACMQQLGAGWPKFMTPASRPAAAGH